MALSPLRKCRAPLRGVLQVLPLHPPCHASLQTAAQHPIQYSTTPLKTQKHTTLPRVRLAPCLNSLTRCQPPADIISDLVDELEEAEDDLDLAEEYVSRIANVPTMADLTGADEGAGAGQQGGK